MRQQLGNSPLMHRFHFHTKNQILLLPHPSVKSLFGWMTGDASCKLRFLKLQKPSLPPLSSTCQFHIFIFKFVGFCSPLKMYVHILSPSTHMSGSSSEMLHFISTVGYRHLSKIQIFNCANCTFLLNIAQKETNFEIVGLQQCFIKILLQQNVILIIE